MAKNTDKRILKDATVCPFCKQKPKGMSMLGHLGFCAYVGCENPKCTVNPRTAMVDAKTEGMAIKKARVSWESRKKK